MSFFKRLKHSAIQSRIEDEGLYERALHEIESGYRRDGLWAQAVERSNGDPDRTVSIYIRLRVQSLRDEQELKSTAISSPSSRIPLGLASRGQSTVYDEHGHTPLMRAVAAKDVQQVRNLLALGADRTIVDGNFGTSRAIDMARLAFARAKTEQEAAALEQIIKDLST
jgi:hypothetical protein